MAISSLSGFLKEARRRRVFRVAALYIVGAWAVLQVSDLAFVSWDIPSEALRQIWIGAVVGFPIALVFGWRYDFVDGRVVRSTSDNMDADLSIAKSDYIILGALTAVVIVIAVELAAEISNTRNTDTTSFVSRIADPKSVAVLPFANLSDSERNAYFVDGLHDDLLSHISKISSIKTISRTSVMQYRDTIKTIPRIAEELGVATIVEGSVQRVDENIRINVQLIDATTDEHLWQETYDRQLTVANIFAIQSEIASSIADALRATLTPVGRKNSIGTMEFPIMRC